MYMYVCSMYEACIYGWMDGWMYLWMCYGWMDARMYGPTYSKIKDQPGKVANPAHSQLNRENENFPVRVRA